MAVNKERLIFVESARHRRAREIAVAHPRKKLAVSLIALAALIALFAALSAAAAEPASAQAAIIDGALGAPP
jgi:hypothetical protein